MNINTIKSVILLFINTISLYIYYIYLIMVDNSNINQIIIDETFRVIKTLGIGYTSKVVLAEHIESGYKLALKIFKPLNNYKLMTESFEKEVDSMKNFRHENLINIIAANKNGICESGNEKESIMYIGIELAENAELFDFIADPGKAFNEDSARLLFSQLIAGIKSMHDQNVAHRDLKTENLFLNGKYNLKIGDFGFSKLIVPTVHEGKLKTQLGTSGYQSPELVEGQFYDGKANDIFACGVILFILVKAYPPFREARKIDNWYRHIYYDKIENFWSCHSKKATNDISNELKELISGMLRYKNRYTIEDVINSNWFKKENSTTYYDEYVKDMNERKKFVEERRNRDAIDYVASQTGQNIANRIYRGEAEDKEFENIVNQLNNYDSQNIKVKKWDNHNSRFVIKFDDTDVKSIYVNFIKKIINEKAKVNISKTEYKLEADIPFSDNVKLGDEQSQENIMINFTAEAYIDLDKENVIIELINNRNTNSFVFKDLMNYLNKKYFK